MNGVEVKNDLQPTTPISPLIMMVCIWICFLVVALCSVIGVITLYIGGLTLCTVCRTHYCRGGSSMCYPCYLAANPGIADAIERKKQVMKDKKKASDKAYREKIKKEKLQGKLHNKNNKSPD